MGDLSMHFNRSEFACRDECGFDAVDIHLIEMLEAARQHFDKSIFINDGCRCVWHNLKVGGEPHSQHLLGKAADIRIDSITPNEVADWFEKTYPEMHGIGRYNTFTHVDCRTQKARWDLRTE